MGVAFAEAGFRTVVLTIDPAKRLAQAMGFETFESDLQRVPGIKGGELWASMLDTERYFDKVIEKFSTSAEQKQKVTSNPLYRTMVESLGGSQEYAAMERLLEFAKDTSFDKVIIDTPPSDNARELFEAPQRLADFMDNSILSWFQGSAGLSLQLFRRGTKIAMSGLKLIFGGEFLDSLAGFLGDLEGMQTGFQNRNLEVLGVLRNKSTAFVLVTTPSESHASDCSAFCLTLSDKKIPLAQLVLNRLEKPIAPSLLGQPENTAEIARVLAYQNTIAEQQEVWSSHLVSMVSCPVAKIDRRNGALNTLSSLSELGHLLID